MSSILRATLPALVGLSCALAMTACDDASDASLAAASFRGKHKGPTNTGSENLHLENTVRFHPIAPGSDAAHGRALFGLAEDLVTGDASEALFEGPSAAFGGPVVSNGRSCFTCHRGVTVSDLGLPVPPLSDTIPLDDPLFTGLHADAQGDPDGLFNMDELGLFKYRPNRFNPKAAADDPFKQVFGWRKSLPLVNLAFAHGFLNDLRGRVMFEVERGAIFSHTQESDQRFDDLFTPQQGDDITAFLFGQVSDPALLALRDPSDPMHEVLVDDPFYTVPVTTKAEKKGKKLFEKHCMDCHDTPNVFNNLANVEPRGNGERPDTSPPWAPAVARGFNVGVAEANVHNLRFTRDVGDGTFAPIVLPLAAEDGTLVPLEVEFDVGLAMTTGRVEDVGRFKVPQLRNLAAHPPYFHDNSAATIEEVVDYFCSDAYNDSADGHRYPIHLSGQQRQDLVAFLEIL